MKYADYIARFSYLLAPAEQQQGKTNGAVAAPPEPVRRQQKEQKQEQRVDVPEELVGIQAYLLWEQEGKPDGADFSEKARKLLEGRLRDGTSVADLEKQLKGPSPPKQQQAAPPQERKQEQHREERREEKQQERKPEKAATTVGKSMGQRQRNPLDFIKRSDGSSNAVMQAKPKYRRTPLTPLVEAAQADKGLHWYRVRGCSALGLGAQAVLVCIDSWRSSAQFGVLLLCRCSACPGTMPAFSHHACLRPPSLLPRAAVWHGQGAGDAGDCATR
jgi:hypothetical protein